MAAVKRVLQGFWQSDTSTKVKEATSISHNDEYYNKNVEAIRESEFPILIGTTYLDHAGTTPYPKSAIESWTTELTSNLFGNPHSASASSQLSTRRIDDIRLKVLQFFNASPDVFTVVFVANATAAIKLVAEAFRDDSKGFWYGYHADSHTSLIGCRELASGGSRCFAHDEDVEEWIHAQLSNNSALEQPCLLGYPGQSNMTGRQLPGDWPRRIRQAATLTGTSLYTLLDAASLAATSSIDLSDAESAPDFMCVSFYKIFGFPDLGALLARRESAGPLLAKRYFAGGNVDAVINGGFPWHARKETLHAALEEGTLPFHNILALDHAMTAHARLFGSMNEVSRHTRYLRNRVRSFLASLQHSNGTRVCEIYEDGKQSLYGPVLSFNIKDSSGRVISASEVEKLCIIKGMQLRTGGVCNPGGIIHHLRLSGPQIQSQYRAGFRCGGENDLIDGQPTGVLRISFGAMSTESDLQSFFNFVREYYVEQTLLGPSTDSLVSSSPRFYVESLCIFPIKSCAGFDVKPDQKWPITSKGLAWDREWCLVHAGTNVVLSQKKYPRMALIKPQLDITIRKMFIEAETGGSVRRIDIDLDDEGSALKNCTPVCSGNVSYARSSTVCGDAVVLQWYNAPRVNNFFSEVLNVPCCLARYPQSSEARKANIRRPLTEKPSKDPPFSPPQIMLANESPMLLVSRSSVDELNRQIEVRAIQDGARLHKEISATSFRANIVVAQMSDDADANSAYAEDSWSSISIFARDSRADIPSTAEHKTSMVDAASSDVESKSLGSTSSFDEPTSLGSTDINTTTVTTNTSYDFEESSDSCRKSVKLDILGPCQRCQMVSIDQITAKCQSEPFSTLAKTRRKGDGRVWFGVHTALSQLESASEAHIQVGDFVQPTSHSE